MSTGCTPIKESSSQLVEYFLNQHTDDFKKRCFSNREMLFSTPSVDQGQHWCRQTNWGFTPIGIDVSVFNCLIAETKLAKDDLRSVSEWAKRIEQAIVRQSALSKMDEFDSRLNEMISALNKSISLLRTINQSQTRTNR